MKNILNLKRTLSVLFIVLLTASCDLDEVNRDIQDTDLVYTSVVGYEGVINYAYNSLYYFYGKIDGIGPLEMGTDLWWAESKYTEHAQYNSGLNTNHGFNKNFWQGFYASINYANLAIYYADQVTDYTEEKRNEKVAEAHFIRGWSYLQIVEQYGGVVLRTLPSSIDPELENFPVRSTELQFYELILSDLEFAAEHLPISQGAEKGRASKKAALGMLAKAYLQRTRLGDETVYAAKALAVAKDLIDNQVAYGCGLWESTATESGYAQLWDGPNNKGNKEFLFLESIDPNDETRANADGTNRGRTRQYYLMDLRYIGEEWGTTQKNCSWYGRANDRGYKPTKYLLTEIFTPEKDPADTRFENTFFTEYYNSRWSDFEISSDVLNKYGKDPALAGHIIKNTAATYYNGEVYYDGRTVYQPTVNASGNVNMVDDDSDGYLDGLSMFTPNYPMTASEKYSSPFLLVTPDEMFDASGKWVTDASSSLGAYYKNCYPSFNKLSSIHWIYNNQRWLGDIPILRLGDVYLLAAEAALRVNNDQATAAGYVNTIRKRAAITSRQNDMVVPDNEVTLDFILAERARELAGEQVRWEDLKRFGKLNNTYLNTTNPDIINFVDDKHILRPIPQAFLDAIGNADEFGTNGY
ncbi:RagB/SusD family nutrient uptake outer membrane protein [Mariniflexile litorale]|uniref:RagB/SusD family nutrient uptake outer membrane protein n=1 Tax=Mariniflexile litorale TaxID=3045158 RepID=A0AAU7E913_9FLAO|nr:RagB/SusD family nutrient uptake outer membrane protein [Mariniflexile sp. KMM 9835]MDQ8210575.1 RagB/SusD family nutrient uptake outer membrane protein [Mariniflexile sp. KMM 9835]